MVTPQDLLQALVTKGTKLVIESEESEEDARHRRRKDAWAFGAALGILVLLVGFALAALMLLDGADLRRQDASRLLTAMIGGVVGYLFGRRSG
jgi:hypothetical protein